MNTLIQVVQGTALRTWGSECPYRSLSEADPVLVALKGDQVVNALIGPYQKRPSSSSDWASSFQC